MMVSGASVMAKVLFGFSLMIFQRCYDVVERPQRCETDVLSVINSGILTKPLASEAGVDLRAKQDVKVSHNPFPQLHLLSPPTHSVNPYQTSEAEYSSSV